MTDPSPGAEGVGPDQAPGPDQAKAPDNAPDPVIEAPSIQRQTGLSDGEWHRLHPASPLLKGGLFLLAVIGFVIAQAREQFFDIFVPQVGVGDENPFAVLIENDLLGWAILALLGILAVLMAVFYVSWRMHTFRVTAEVVEVRSGVLYRTNRKARLDRIQGINIVRPFIARLFGAAKLEVSQAGQDANVQLEYLATAAADDLRRDILRLASGSRVAMASREVAPGQVGVLDQRVNDFLAPELDPDAAEPESVVRIPVGRLIGSLVLSSGTMVLLAAVIGVAIVSAFQPQAALGLIGIIPAVLGVVGYGARKLLKSLRYSIAGTPDGVRVGFGLLSTSNETLPPGRIHSVRLSQPLLWRPFGWWEVTVNVASHSSTSGAAGQQNTTILPVGTLADARRVLGLVLPEFDDGPASDLVGSGIRASDSDGYVSSPRRAAVLRPLSWRRNGIGFTQGAVLFRTGAVWRELTIVPFPRAQSVSIAQGPLLRALRLASLRVHTVAGPIVASIGAQDRDAALAAFHEIAASAVRTSLADTSHRWRQHEGESGQ